MRVNPECGDELKEAVLEPTVEEARHELFERLSEGGVSGVEKAGLETVVFYDDRYCGRVQIQETYWNDTQAAEIVTTNPDRVEAVLQETNGEIRYKIRS